VSEQSSGFGRDYLAALEAYLRSGDELTLSRAYQLGRHAIGNGLGVLDMAVLHRGALDVILVSASPGDQVRITSTAADFFTELLSPFEMSFRGYRSANEELQRQAEQLRTANETVVSRNATLLSAQQQLEQRAAELELVNRDLERTSLVLREKVSDLENVSNTLSHDLRAPLRSIRGFSEVLAEALHDKLDAEARDALDRVLAAGERMGRMLDDLYRLLRLSGASVAATAVAVEAVLHDVTQDLRIDFEQESAALTHDELPTLWTNGMLVRQILQNLIANAIRFRGAEPPVVHVGAVRRADAWELSVRDNGVGIRPDARERVFWLFERLSSEGAGTGVGLALCKRAVEKLGGRIWVGSHAGPGTTFCFTIPHDPRSARP
jgi:signal transduction histidine kinase